MILDRTWNKKEQKFTISYVDKNGNRKFFQKALHHIKTYEYDKNGDYDTWNHKKCRRIFKDTTSYVPNEFDLLEYMYELEPELNKQLHALYFPKVYTFDIETEVSDEFPDPDKAEQMVTSISVVAPDMSCIVYGLNKLNQDSINLFKQRYLDWIDNNAYAKRAIGDKTPRVLYQYFETEAEMLKHFYTVIVPKCPCLAGWNAYGFDFTFLWNRMVRIFGTGEAYNILRKSSPTGELGKVGYVDMGGKKHTIPAPNHVLFLDYMELVKQYDYTLRPYESYSLDWVSEHAIDAHKIKYNGTLQQLYENDPEWYYFYNAIDSLLTQLIHHRLKCLKSPAASSAVTLVPILTATGQISLTTANVFEEFYKDNKKVVYDYDEIARVKIEYEGAFCGCVPGRYEFNVCEDFASLYPSQVRTCNFSFENYVENKVGPDSLGRYTIIPWSEKELEEKRKDPNYFVSIMGNVYKNDKDYAFKRLMEKTMKLRSGFKYTGQKLEAELLVEIDNIINGTPTHMNFSKEIYDVLETKFDNIDIYNLSGDNLLTFKEEVEQLREEYTLLELGYKVLANAAYGSSASPFFYFFNVNLAADITGECRNLTQTMNKNLIEWFHEGIWQRKDLWEKFDFELDESKHDWYREQKVWIYSDTDSSYVTYGTFFDAMTPESQAKYDTDKKKVDWILKYNLEFQDKLNNKWCEDIYNPRFGKNVHEFELETVVRTQINLKKKKYLKGYAYSKGKFFDKPKISGTGIELIKSTTPALCKEILKDLMYSLMFEYDVKDKYIYIENFNKRLADWKKKFYAAEAEQISQSVGVGDYKKYIIDDTDELIFGKQCPVSVKAVARFNYLAHKNGEDNKKFYSGKIKYYNINLNNMSGNKGIIDYFGYPAGELPEWAPKMDKLTQWRKTVIDPINRFLEVMDIPLVNETGNVQYSLFD